MDNEIIEKIRAGESDTVEFKNLLISKIISKLSPNLQRYIM